MLRCGWDGFAAQNSRLGFCSTVGINNHAQTTQLDALMQLGYFRNTKGQRDFISTLAFIASHEARRRMAVFSIQLARSHTRPASREARCRAAVTPQPSCFPTSTPAPYGRGVGCRGAAPAKSQRRFTSTLAFIASHEACCRMAVFAMQVTGIHTRPASRGTRRATAVTPQPSCMSLYAPARIARSPGSRGTAPA